MINFIKIIIHDSCHVWGLVERAEYTISTAHYTAVQVCVTVHNIKFCQHLTLMRSQCHRIGIKKTICKNVTPTITKAETKNKHVKYSVHNVNTTGV